MTIFSDNILLIKLLPSKNCLFKGPFHLLTGTVHSPTALSNSTRQLTFIQTKISQNVNILCKTLQPNPSQYEIPDNPLISFVHKKKDMSKLVLHIPAPMCHVIQKEIVLMALKQTLESPKIKTNTQPGWSLIYI